MKKELSEVNKEYLKKHLERTKRLMKSTPTPEEIVIRYHRDQDEFIERFEYMCEECSKQAHVFFRDIKTGYVCKIEGNCNCEEREE